MRAWLLGCPVDTRSMAETVDLASAAVGRAARSTSSQAQRSGRRLARSNSTSPVSHSSGARARVVAVRQDQYLVRMSRIYEGPAS